MNETVTDPQRNMTIKEWLLRGVGQELKELDASIIETREELKRLEEKYQRE